MNIMCYTGITTHLQATDTGGKYSQTIVEVTVVPGPNTRGPVFESPVYEVQVSEGASINSTVTTVSVSSHPATDA
jgi:protocadherin-15